MNLTSFDKTSNVLLMSLKVILALNFGFVKLSSHIYMLLRFDCEKIVFNVYSFCNV